MFYFTYLRRELSRRMRQEVVTGAGLGLPTLPAAACAYDP
jgi:hypothetical protein